MDKCRLCNTDPDPRMCQHIFNSKFKPPMWKIIKQISRLIITKNDPYTKTICGPCFIKLVEYSAFRKTILDTDYQLQHAEELLSKKTNDDCDYFEVHCTSSSSDSDDSIVKEEEIDIEEHSLEIDDEIEEELNNSSIAIIDNQNIEELTIGDGFNNNDKVPVCCKSPDDNSNETNERQDSKSSTLDKIDFNRDSTETDGSYTISTNNNNSRLTVNDDIIPSDGKEISTTKDIVDSSKNFDDNSLSTNSNNNNNVENEESDLEMNNNNIRKYNTRYSQRLNVDNSIDIEDKTRKKNSESSKRHRNARYGSKMNLKVHNRKTLQTNAEMQTPERPLKSNICNKQSSGDSNLYRNEKVHTDNKSYRCNICDKQFLHKAYLRIHKRVHTGEKPFECNICKKQFVDNWNLRRHERVHTGEKPFTCTICNKQFSDKTNLRHHERVHTGEKPFTCDICKKQFAQKSYLRIHKRVHTGEKPFKCNICNKSFTTRSYIRDHLNIHTGQKPYCCNICNEMFSFRTVLNEHLRFHRDERVRM